MLAPVWRMVGSKLQAGLCLMPESCVESQKWPVAVQVYQVKDLRWEGAGLNGGGELQYFPEL
jgi:hypothetical protein